MEYLLHLIIVVATDNLPELTRREKEALQYIAEGPTNNRVAAKLFVSPSTVDTHRKNMLVKLQVNSTVALIKLAVKQRLI
jgi:DNA-binding CsgD family transcriptional regulator